MFSLIWIINFFHKSSQFQQLKKKTNFLLLQNCFFLSQFTSLKRNNNGPVFCTLLFAPHIHTAISDPILFHIYLLVDLFEVLEIMAQMWHYIIFSSHKPTKVISDFILNYLKKVVGGATAQKYQKQMLKP